MTATADTPRINLGTAQIIAGRLRAAILDSCEQVEIAGSIRRGKEAPRDIELVAIPRIDRTPTDLFSTEYFETDRLDMRVREMLANEDLEHRLDKNGRRAYGDRYKRLRHVATGIALDLFSVLPPAQFGVILTIRTGSRDFSEHLVTSRLIGGALPPNMLVRDGCLYRHLHGMDLPVDKEMRRGYPAGWLVEVPTPTEREFFSAIDMPWVEPEAR